MSRAQLTEAERDLLAQLMSTPAEAADAVTELEPADLVGLAARALLESAQALARDERTQGRSGRWPPGSCRSWARPTWRS